MGTDTATAPDPGAELLDLYDRSLPQVYGYLLSRCGRVSLAEDLTSQTFLAAAHAVRRGGPTTLSAAWLMTVARNKMVDHWRREAREERGMTLLGGPEPTDDPWDGHLDALRARETLEALGAHHRAALTLRYVDNLPVAEVAQALERSLHATERCWSEPGRLSGASTSETRPVTMPDTHPQSFEATLGEALRSRPEPAYPERRFAARLRARLERALTLPKGVDVTMTTIDPSAVIAEPATMEVTPYLAVTGARRALEWYADVFGAVATGEPMVMPDGRIGHAQLSFGGATVMLAEESAGVGHVAPRPGEGNSVTIHLQVPAVDSLLDRAVSLGAVLDRAPSDNPYGRTAVVHDPFGHRWILASPKPWSAPARYPAGTRHGDIGHISLEVPDVERAASFYSSVLGRAYAPGHNSQGRLVLDSMPDTSLMGGQPRDACVITWRVDNIALAVEVVRRRGGSATDPFTRPYGTMSECTDDQGMRFYLWQPTDEERAAGDRYRAPAERGPSRRPQLHERLGSRLCAIPRLLR